jgi:opacity protein-like surface antigen
MTRRLSLLSLLALAAPAAQAADGPRLTVSAYGVFAPPSVDYTTARTFDAFAEEGSITTDYEAGKGPGGELGLTWRFSKSFGVGVAGTVFSRDTVASYTTRVPHPLFLNRDRTAEGTVDVEYQETAGHLDVVYTGGSGSLDFAIFAGPSFVKLSADLLGDPVYSQDYPFDEITVSNVPARTADDSGIGFNAGASLAYRFSKSVAFGVQGRFTRASLQLSPVDGEDDVEIDAGGLQVGAGFRFSF